MTGASLESVATDQEKAHHEKISAVSEKWLYLALLAALLLALWIQGPHLPDPYAVEEDARSFYWWHSFEDPALFRDTARYQNSIIELPAGGLTLIIEKTSPGYSLLFQLANTFMPAILFSKLLIFPLMLATVYYTYRISRKFAGPRTSFAVSLALVLLNLASPTAIALTGGLQRSFTFPLLLAIVYYLMERRYVATAVVLVLSGSIYPPILVLGAATYGLALLQPRADEWHNVVQWKRLPPLLIAGVLVTLLMLPILTQRATSSGAQAEESGRGEYSLFEDPTYQPGGRRELFLYYPLVGRMGLATDGSNILHITLLSLAAIATFLIHPASLARFPRELKLLFAASFLCFFAAIAIALITDSFLLYLPSRYTQASLPLFLIVYVVLNARQSMQRATALLYRHRRYAILLIAPFAVAALLVALLAPDPPASAGLAPIFPTLRLMLGGLSVALVLLSVYSALRKSTVATAGLEAREMSGRAWMLMGGFALTASLLYVNVFHAPFYSATATERNLYQFLETLPRDTLIAGSPCSLDGVPLFARRQILFSCEDPHHDGAVMQDALEAYYAASAAEVQAFCRAHGVDYLLVNTEDFEPQRIAAGDYFFEPYNSKLQPQVATRDTFALLQTPEESKQFAEDNLFLVACEALPVDED